MTMVAPSILSADFNHLADDIKSCGDIKYLHCDIMDGVFVPNFTMGPCVLKNIKKEFPNLLLDVHLMVKEPEKFADFFMPIKPDIVTFHYEVYRHAEDGIAYLKNLGVKVGVSIKPNTDVNVVEDLLDKVDLLLVMSVEPGFGGQAFMDSALPKIKRLKELKDKYGYNFIIEVDGGINEETGKLCADAGADLLVAGSYVFKSTDRIKAIEAITK